MDDVSKFEVGQELKVEELFDVGDLVDVAGTSTGKGFQGMLMMMLGLTCHDGESCVCVYILGKCTFWGCMVGMYIHIGYARNTHHQYYYHRYHQAMGPCTRVDDTRFQIQATARFYWSMCNP